MAKPNLKRINEREKKLKTSHTKLTCKYHKFKMNKWKKDEKMDVWVLYVFQMFLIKNKIKDQQEIYNFGYLKHFVWHKK